MKDSILNFIVILFKFVGEQLAKMEDGQDTGTCLKESSPSELEIDEEMEMDEGSAGEEEEEEVCDPGSSPSPEQPPALVHGSSEQAGTTGMSWISFTIVVILETENDSLCFILCFECKVEMPTLHLEQCSYMCMCTVQIISTASFESRDCLHEIQYNVLASSNYSYAEFYAHRSNSISTVNVWV